jgi:F-type H+-transporting ATPase subunit epsilon
MATISFDLVSPENLVFNDEVGTIIVPGKDGDLGILPGHSKVMSSLRPGRVMVYSEDKNLIKSFFVSGGFAEINPEKCIVLAESVVEVNSLEKTSIEKEIQNLEGVEDDSKKEQLNIAKAKIDAIESNYYEKI